MLSRLNNISLIELLMNTELCARGGGRAGRGRATCASPVRVSHPLSHYGRTILTEMKGFMKFCYTSRPGRFVFELGGRI